jgi:hypothetical protein
MRKTIKPFSTTFRDFGTIVVPVGVEVTSQTAMGVDASYNFVNVFAWVRRDYESIHTILIHDLRHYGLHVPEEFLGPDENPVPFIPETDSDNYPVGPDGRVVYAGLSYAAKNVAIAEYMRVTGLDEEIAAHDLDLHEFKFHTDGTHISMDIIAFESLRNGVMYWFNHENGSFDNSNNIDDRLINELRN